MTKISTQLINDALVHTEYERLRGFWHPYDITQQKKNSMHHKSWGISTRINWQTRETYVCIASTYIHEHPLTCPRLRYAYHLKSQQKHPEVALIYYHAQAWHACIYEYALLTRYLRQDDPDATNAGLFHVWQLMLQQYPKAGILHLLCAERSTMQKIQTQCRNPCSTFSFSL